MKVSPLSFSMLQNYGLAIFYFTANSVLTVIFPLQAANHGMKEAEIGLMMGIYMFVCMVLRPWAGQMVSKYSVHTVMKYLLLGHVAALLLYVSLGVESLYVVRILQGIVTAFSPCRCKWVSRRLYEMKIEDKVWQCILYQVSCQGYMDQH